MLTIHVPPTCPKENAYILDLIFNRYWGVDYQLSRSEDDWYRIESENGTLKMPGVFFRQLHAQGISGNILPQQPLSQMRLDSDVSRRCCLEDKLPVIYGMADRTNAPVKDGDNITLPVDIPGSAFFMLSRLEELISHKQDEHGRFPVQASLAYQAGFLHRPVINEYLELLWHLLSEINPGLHRKPHSFMLSAGHDVDVPFLAYKTGAGRFVRGLLSELNTRRRAALVLPMITDSLRARTGKYKADPYFTFDYIMSQSEKRNLKSRFFMIADSSSSNMDGTYDISDPEIISLLANIGNRGHEVALHCSYLSCKDGQKIKYEFDLLRSHCESLGINQSSWSSRQHYLRFSAAETFRLLDQAGINFDETMTYAGSPGFRCGICYEFPVYDLTEGRQLDIIERPLIVMDSSILLKRYAATTNDQRDFESLIRLKQACKRYNGNFSLLWHNNHLSDARERELYEMILDA